MIRALLRLVIVVVLVAAAIAFFLGYRWGDGHLIGPTERPVATTGRTTPEPSGIDTQKARERGAEVGEKVATGVNRAERALADGSLTAKIKSKMALDDTVKAADIHVDTSNGVVTLRGTVHSEAEHTRAVQLARETAGVTNVVDKLTVR